VYRPTRGARGTVIVLGVATILVMVVGIVSLSMAAYIASVAVLAVLFWISAFVTVLRSGAWLEGTTLITRGALTTRRCDLASSAVRVSPDPGSGAPVLTAQDQAGTVRLPLRVRGRRLFDPDKLQALANAILAGGRQDADGWQAASQLRALAGAAPVAPPRY
jgi:hypothetical protein